MRRVLAAAAVAMFGLAGLVGPAQAEPTGVYSVPWSTTRGFWHFHFEGEPPETYETEISGERVVGPAPGISYVKYAWAPSIYGVAFFDPADEQAWGWKHLTYDEWLRAGSPRGQWNAGWIEGTELVKYATSPEIIASIDGVSHKLTYAEWRAMGFRSPESRHEGYRKLTWDSGIAYYYTASDGYQIDYGHWRDAGFPTPAESRMLPGDYVCRYAWSGSTLYYVGATFNGPLTYAQWRAAGFPQPRAC